MDAILNPPLDARVSEFASTQEADAYTAWLRNEVGQRLNDNSQAVPHDQVMARMDALLAKFN